MSSSKRMLSKSIITKNEFIDLSVGCQALYVQLNMYADDDGIVNNAEAICKMLKQNEKQLAKLIEKRFIIKIEVDVEEDDEDDDYFYDSMIAYAITDWLIHNHIAIDRYHPDDNNAVFREKIFVNKNKRYTLNSGKEEKNDSIDGYRAKNFRRRQRMDEFAEDSYLDD